jgi:diguanylate cyclase (GGDEF)-like protein
LRLAAPYLALAPLGWLVLRHWGGHAPDVAARGVFYASIAVVICVVARQLLALAENSRLQHATAAYARRLEQLATTDPITELPNHRAMAGALTVEIERAARSQRSVAVLFLDLDHFKTLNDTFGHAAGDELLAEFARVASSVLRSIDTLGRWGGEEFVVILPEATTAEALRVAERVRGVVASHHFGVGGGAHLTCSLGVASYPADAGDADALLRVADQAQYLAKRLGRNQARGAADPAAATLDGDLQDASRDAVATAGAADALATLVAARDQRTGAHAHAVAQLALRLAVALGLGAEEAHMIGVAGRLHDIGKVAVPDAILQKAGPLTDAEWAIMRTHPSVGAEVLACIPALRPLGPLVRAHHERWDGAGYPDRLAGDAIPLGARILGVVDAYTAMTVDRPYRAARSAAYASAELRRGAGAQFDPTVVAAFERVLALLAPAGEDAPPTEDRRASG